MRKIIPVAFVAIVLTVLIGLVPGRIDRSPEASAASPVPARDAGPYRILSVGPASASDETTSNARGRRRHRSRSNHPAIEIHFSRDTDLVDVRGALVVDPPVELSWGRAAQESSSTITLPGAFQPGAHYLLKIARPFSDKERDATVATCRLGFDFPGNPAFVKLQSTGPVMERKCHQIVHIGLRDVERLKIEATRVPLLALLSTKPSWSATSSISEVTTDWSGREKAMAPALKTAPFSELVETPAATESEAFVEPGEQGRDRRCSLPLSWRASAGQGATYLLQVRSLDGAEPPASELSALQITDLSLSLKVAPGELIVWATRMGTGEVVPQARVWLGLSTGRIVAAGQTDADGLLRIKNEASLPAIDTDAKSAPAPVALDLSAVRRVLAVAGPDQAWIDTDATTVHVPSSVETADRTDNFTRAHAFTERGIYRPGDSVRFKVTVRRFAEGTASAPTGRCVVVVNDARGKVAKELELPLSDFGTAWGTIPVRAHDPTGEWTLEVREPEAVDKSADAASEPETASAKEPSSRYHGRSAARLARAAARRQRKTRKPAAVWGRTTFRVEEFVAPRHKVDVTFRTDPPAAQAGAPARTDAPPTITAVIAGRYFAGGPVKNGKVRWRATLEGTRHTLDRMPGYAAGTDLAGEPQLLESGEATLDAAGNAALVIPLSSEVRDGRRSLSLSATALDFDARAATGEGRYSATPDYLVAITTHPEQVERNTPLDLSCVVIDRTTGKKVETGEVAVTVLQEGWASIQKRNDDGDFFWTGEQVMTRYFESRVRIADGQAPVHVNFGHPGHYQLAVAYATPDGRHFQSTTTFQVDWSGGEEESGDENWRARALRRLSLAADLPEYVPGEVAHIRMHPQRTPVSLLLAIERDGIVSLKRMQLPAGATTFDLPIEEGFCPNVYVSVLATHAREEFPVYAGDADTGAPGYSHGYLSLPVHKLHGDLTVKLTGAGNGVTVLPGQSHTVGLTVTDREGKPVAAEVALAVVDESVLALTAFATPTLAKLFEIVLPLAVRTLDLREILCLQTPFKAFTIRALTGGDGGRGARTRTRSWFDPVAYFKPDLRTDAHGQASATFTLPDSMTTYRVYAVACDATTLHGSTDAPLLCRKPFYLEAGLPRFFTRGDRGRFNVTVFNGTGKPGAVHLTAAADGPLALTVPRQGGADPEVAAGDKATLPVEFTANGAGHAKVRLTAKLGADTDTVELPVPVRAATVERIAATDGTLQSGREVVELALPPEAQQLTQEGVAQTKVSLELSQLAALRLLGALDYLLEYPHGCIEQTSSGVLALGSLRQLVKAGLVPGMDLATIDRYLGPGIERVLSMQTDTGGFGYWPGNTTPHPYGSVYAMMALAVAKKAGFAVEAEPRDLGLGYLERLAKPVPSLSKDNTGEFSDEASVARARPFAAYVLRLHERPAPRVGSTLAPGAVRVADDVYFLLLTQALSGSAATGREELERWLNARKEGETTPLFDFASFGTPVKTRALELLTENELEPGTARQGVAIAALQKEIRPTGSWGSTQETAWSLMALSGAFAKAATTGASAETGVEVTAARVATEPTPVSVKVPARDLVRVDLDGAAFLAHPQVTLAPAAGTEPRPVSYRLLARFPWPGPTAAAATMTRTYKRLAGSGPIRVGDLVSVTVTMRSPRELHYVCLVDPLPAGLVAINSALATEEKVDAPETGGRYEDEWVGDLSPDHLELRDDHVMAARDYCWQGRYRFSYVARAVCEGTFTVPPARFEPMYQPEETQYSTATTLEVAPPGK